MQTNAFKMTISIPMNIPAGTGRKNDVVLTSMRRNHVASTSIEFLAPKSHLDVIFQMLLTTLIRVHRLSLNSIGSRLDSFPARRNKKAQLKRRLHFFLRCDDK